MIIQIEYWSPLNKVVEYLDGSCHYVTDSVAQREQALDGTMEEIFKEFHDLNNQLRYCNGSYYKFKTKELSDEYYKWLTSLSEATRFSMYYGTGVVD